MFSPALPRSAAEPAIVAPSTRERGVHGALKLASILAALGMVAVFAVALWAWNGLTPVEAIVGLHSHYVRAGRGAA